MEYTTCEAIVRRHTDKIVPILGTHILMDEVKPVGNEVEVVTLPICQNN